MKHDLFGWGLLSAYGYVRHAVSRHQIAVGALYWMTSDKGGDIGATFIKAARRDTANGTALATQIANREGSSRLFVLLIGNGGIG